MEPLEEFILLSRYAGMREDLIQAGGGNTSLKLSDTEMYIKASGFQLADVSENDGYALVNPRVITDYFRETPLERIDGKTEKELLQAARIRGARPSIETFLHSITDRVTLHTHPTAVNVLTARKGGMKALEAMFPGALLVDYATPGIQLAKIYYKEYKKQGGCPEIVFLKNHGMVVSGKTAEDVIARTESILKTIEVYLKLNGEAEREATGIWRTLCKADPSYRGIVWLSHEPAANGLLQKTHRMWDYQFCPDCIVYCGRKALVLPERYTAADFLEHRKKYGSPIVILWKDHIYLAADSVKKAKEIESVLRFSAMVADCNANGDMDLLSEKEQDFLLNWDSEKYRKNLK